MDDHRSDPTKDDDLASLMQAALQAPGDARAWTRLGRAHLLHRQWAEAEKVLERAVALDRDHRNAWFHLGVVRSELERKDEAVSAFREAIRINADDADAWYNLGVAQRDCGQHKDCIHAFQEAVRIQPLAGDAWNNLALEHSRAGDTEAAMEAAFRLRKVDIDQSNYLIKHILGMKWK